MLALHSVTRCEMGIQIPTMLRESVVGRPSVLAVSNVASNQPTLMAPRSSKGDYSLEVDLAPPTPVHSGTMSVLTPDATGIP